MKQLNHIISTLLLTAALATFPATLNAKSLIDQSNNVFQFQQKLANNGNINAQYKLGLMYETGEGVEASFEKALHWYGRAAKSGLKKADHRNTYLMVKELGFNKKMHSDWLDSVKIDANDHKPDAMLLLGQLYRQGLGVKKNLKKSLDLLTEVSVLGDADIDDEIESIYAEMEAASKKRKVAVKKKAYSPSVSKTEKVAKKKAAKKTPAVSTAKVDKAAAEKQRIQAEKVRRYEKAMAQLKREQELIDAQQADVSGGAVASVDDEI